VILRISTHSQPPVNYGLKWNNQ